MGLPTTTDLQARIAGRSPKGIKMSKYSLKRNETDGGISEALVVKFDDGQVESAEGSHPYFQTLLEQARAFETTGVEPERELFNPAFAINIKFQKITDRVAVRNSKIYLDQDEVDSSLSRAIIRAMHEDADFTGLALFMENLMANPQEYSRQYLYEWLNADDFTITEDGCFIGYKGVSMRDDGKGYSTTRGHAFVNGEEFTDSYIPNQVGDVVEMPRSEVAFDPNQSCSSGLHVGTHSYSRSFGDTKMHVKINPRDVVSVPSGEREKMRVCRYEVLGFSEGRFTAQVVSGPWTNPSDEPESHEPEPPLVHETPSVVKSKWFWPF